MCKGKSNLIKNKAWYQTQLKTTKKSYKLFKISCLEKVVVWLENFLFK